MHWPPMKIDILDRVKHPNLVRMFDLIISPDEILVIMELIDGGEMFDFCEV
jgi:serine/threonine protein kinase